MTASVKQTNTAFIRLDRRTGWRADDRLTENLYQEPSSGALHLGSADLYPIAPSEAYGSFGGQTLPTGVFVHPEGRVLLADPYGNQILYYIPPFGNETKTENAADYWPFRPLWTATEEPEIPAPMILEPEAPNLYETPYRLNQPNDVAFSSGGDLVVVDSGNSRLVFYAWPSLKVRHILVIDGTPAAVAFDCKGNGYVADSQSGQVWRFDPLWRLDEEYVGGVDTLQQPEHIAIDSEDNVLVLDSATQAVFLLDHKGRIVTDDEGEPLSIAGLKLFERRFVPPFSLTQTGLEYPQPNRPRCPTLILQGVEVDKYGRLEGTLLPLIARSRRIALPRSGVFVSERLDSGLPGCQWHRVVLDSNILSSTRLIVQTFASDVPLESSRVNELGAEDWSQALLLGEQDLPEVLIQSSAGRYLWLRIEFFGDGEQSPQISAIEIQAPRRSSLQWLPPIFKSDPDSAHFLDRFLSYFDTVYAEAQHEIEHFARLLDPYAVPAGEFLDWLGSWFDWRFLAEWPIDTRREMIAHAVEFFRQRGTLAGLRRMLQWHTGLSGNQPQIIEHFRLRDYVTRRQPRGDLCGDRLYIGGRPLDPSAFAHWFTIVVPVSAVPDEEAKETLERIIKAQKPAHTGYQLRVIEPGLRVGCQSTVGVDTWLSDYPAEPLGDMSLGQSSRLADSNIRS